MAASVGAGLFTSAAAVAQTTVSGDSPTAKTAKKKQNSAPPAGAATAQQTSTQAATIVVTGQRRALESATELKRRSDTVSDSVVLDEAGKVPSTSLLEILDRVPGITMNRVRAGAEGSPDGFTFEGSGIQIRGLTGTKTLVNGLEVFSANGGNGLSYSDIGPELLKAVTVYKAGRADLIEGGIAGTVDLQTYMPFDFQGTKISGAVSGSYGDFSKVITPSASIRASTRFHTGIGEIGILADVAISKIKGYDSNFLVNPYYPTKFNGGIAYAPGGFSATDDQFTRTRKGFYGAIQWRPAPGLEFYHTTFISQWNSNRDTELLNWGQSAISATSDSVFDNGVFVRGGLTNTSVSAGIPVGSNASFTPSNSKVADFTQGFKYSSGRWNFSGSYQNVTARSSTHKFGLGVSQPGMIQTNIDTAGDIPDISFATPFVADPAKTTVGNIVWLSQANRSHSSAWQLDASYDLGDGFFKKLAVGGRIANRKETDNFVGTWWSASGHGWNGVPSPVVGNAPASDFYLETFPDFFKGQVAAPASVYVPASSALQASQFERIVNTYAACAPNLWFKCSKPAASSYLYGNPPDPNFGTQPSFSTTKPDTRSAYAMLGFSNHSDSPFLNFSGNIGVRWVRYDASSEGNYVFSGNTVFFKDLADAQASFAQIGGVGNYAAWQKANPGQQLPLTMKSVSYSAERSGRFSRDYLMPAFNIKFEPSHDWIVRYALTKALTPPLFNDIRAQGTASVFTNQNPLTSASGVPGIFGGYNYTSGVPSLKPETSLNNDLSIEWYPKKSTTFHLALFHKSIKNAILYNVVTGTASQFFSTTDLPMSTPAGGGSATFLDGPIIAKGNVNANGHAIIKGAEVGARTYFDSLPGFLKGFGVDANATYIDGHSPSAYALDMNGHQVGVPLIGLSKWAYSTTLLYDLHKWSARLAWTWRSRYLVTESDASTSGTYTDPVSKQTIAFGLPVYASAAGRLDGSIGYEFSKSFNLRLDVENITNANQRTEMEILPGRYVQRGVFVTDRRVSLRAGFSF